MLKFVKALHLLGMVMFFGSILERITLGFVPGAQDEAQTMQILRQINLSANYFLTLPGLALLFITGVLLVAKGDSSIPRTNGWQYMPYSAY